MNILGVNLKNCMHYTPTRYESSLIRFPDKKGVNRVICVVCREEVDRESVMANEVKLEVRT